MKRILVVLKEGAWLALAAAIVVGGVLGFQTLGALKETAEPSPAARVVPVVDTLKLTDHDAPLPIRGEGFVSAFRKVALSAQTSGRIVELSPALDRNGRFEKGEVLARLDNRAAQVALARTDADIEATRARLNLNGTQLERASKLRDRGVVSQDRLDTLLSQKAELQAVLASLQAARESAAVALDYLEIRAPFAGRVLSKEAELGAVVNPGEPVAQIYTDRALEVTIPLRQRDAALIPGLFGAGAAPAVIDARFGGRAYRWRARVARVDPGLDARTRTIDVTLRIEDAAPRQLDSGDAPASGPPPALINVFVEAVIDGARIPGLHAIPSTALREADTIWLYEDGALRITPVEIAHVDGETTYVRPEAALTGAALITSALSAPAQGMKLRAGDAAPLLAAAGD